MSQITTKRTKIHSQNQEPSVILDRVSRCHLRRGHARSRLTTVLIVRSIVHVQSEFYPKKGALPDKDGLVPLDMDAATVKAAPVVAFNGRAFRHMKEPLKATPGERIRLFVLNADPSGTSSFHVIGTIFDRVWLDGNPGNEQRGLQSVLLGSSNGAIVEFVIPEKGVYTMVDHEFADANAGAVGSIDASGG